MRVMCNLKISQVLLLKFFSNKQCSVDFSCFLLILFATFKYDEKTEDSIFCCQCNGIFRCADFKSLFNLINQTV